MRVWLFKILIKNTQLTPNPAGGGDGMVDGLPFRILVRPSCQTRNAGTEGLYRLTLKYCAIQASDCERVQVAVMAAMGMFHRGCQCGGDGAGAIADTMTRSAHQLERSASKQIYQLLVRP